MPRPPTRPGETEPVPARRVRHAPAKINLYLQVTGRRPDGYHLLDSLVVFAGAGAADRIRVEAAPDLAFAVEGPFAAAVPAGPDNLVMRAAARLRQRFGIAAGARITLDKALPVAAGIGGGSADAAAALSLLSELWAIPTDDPAFAALALELGADVPVCLAGRPTLMRGIGDHLRDAPPLPAFDILLANDGGALLTADVFRALDGRFAAAPPALPAIPDFMGLVTVLAARRNDLEAPALALRPALGAVLEALRGLDGAALARMSGSGGTCYAILPPGAGPGAAATLAARRPGWWIATDRVGGQ
ncbi:4-(cytidine 5'-diphospho)-2-C-methyl-D-erythritol kinase [Oceanibacterium hippocampi]|uniref:4-diphosphocytidyl-2-C-methyl-D-erythritol kinase n=1 Tax=Oceanibacterium hippocampi TaxID=745714 RepID=A0A1Y5S7T5_9PROT|nr:4-(cytidine 5'-diphospho)-2-C-methyl-D-erythritol kinase [Oceanibacterium hippocampi]SLN34102.1 4-diphosphocytidyl-2-C-methyl-D-erythritol kinase [Oceanibacterium hippocampi]